MLSLLFQQGLQRCFEAYQLEFVRTLQEMPACCLFASSRTFPKPPICPIVAEFGYIHQTGYELKKFNFVAEGLQIDNLCSMPFGMSKKKFKR